DHRSDLFSLGTVLYAMCTGHPPFRASGTHAVLKRVIDAAPRPIREINNEIPDWLCAIIARLHAKKPAERFQTAKEVADILERYLAHWQQPGRAPLPPRVTRPAGPSVETDDPVVAAALAQVRTPAIGLFVTGILYWVGIPVAFWIGLDEWLVGNHGSYLWWALGVLPTLSGFVLILGGWQMKGLEWYRWSLAAACLPLLLLAE